MFEGNLEHHGKFMFSGEKREDGKVLGGGKTVREPVTVDLWTDHLKGKVQIGIIPINQDSFCKFGAIDIDTYNLDYSEVLKKIEKHKLPLVFIRSKSGGAHLYCFCRKYVKASVMQKKLREMASMIGQGTAEIFPKQTEVLKERGDVGQWINMPYFGADATERYAVTLTNKKVELEAFIRLVDNKQIEPDELENFEPELSSYFEDGPPCLQHIDTIGLQEGFRNQGMMNIAIYHKKKYSDDWQKRVEEYNLKLAKPLPPKEILILIDSVKRKEYNYTCKKQPICDHCNAKLCRTRKFGVNEGDDFPSLSSLTKICTEPPLWFIEVEDAGRVELTTEELQSPRYFQRRCMDALSMVPPMVNNKVWLIMIAELMKDLNEVEIPMDLTPSGQLMQHLEDFCLVRPGDENAECLLRGNIWNYDNHHHFRLSDFLQYLDRKRFNYFRSNQITTILKEYGVTTKGVNIKKGVFRNIMKVKYFDPEQHRFTIPEEKSAGDIAY